MQFLNKIGVGDIIARLKEKFGSKTEVDEVKAARQQYLLEIDYDKDLAFDITEKITD